MAQKKLPLLSRNLRPNLNFITTQKVIEILKETQITKHNICNTFSFYQVT